MRVPKYRLNKPNVDRKNIINVRAEANKIDNSKAIEKFTKLKLVVWNFYKINETLARPIEKKRENTNHQHY